MRTKKEVLYTCLTNQIVPDKEISEDNICSELITHIESWESNELLTKILAAMQEYATEWSKAGEEQNELDSYIENLEQEWK